MRLISSGEVVIGPRTGVRSTKAARQEFGDIRLPGRSADRDRSFRDVAEASVNVE